MQQFETCVTMKHLVGKVKGGTTGHGNVRVCSQVNSATSDHLWFSHEAHFHLNGLWTSRTQGSEPLKIYTEL